MITANDLRIGNLITDPEFPNIPSTVTQIQTDGFIVTNYNDHLKNEDAVSIELNNVNLLKCGFALGDGYYWKTWGTNGVFIVKFDTVYNKFFVQAGKGFNLLVEYIHELQNVFYVFTLGRELEVVW